MGIKNKYQQRNYPQTKHIFEWEQAQLSEFGVRRVIPDHTLVMLCECDIGDGIFYYLSSSTSAILSWELECESVELLLCGFSSVSWSHCPHSTLSPEKL